MFNDLKINDIVAVIGVLSTFLTAIIGLIGYRWSKQVVEAKEAQIATLKEQITALKDLSPETIKKQSQSIIESLQTEIATVRNELSSTRSKLKEKSSKLDEALTQQSVERGIPKALFEISDYELELRRLASFIMRSSWQPREFPSDQDYAYEFYLKVLEFYQRNPLFTSHSVSQASEWILDFLFYPLLACMIQAPHLKNRASAIYQDFLAEIESQGLLSDEVPLYRNLQQLALRDVAYEYLKDYSTFQFMMIKENGVEGFPYSYSQET